MTYSAGSLIQAADYNGFAGGSAGANVSGQINTVLSTGNGNAGYGQTAVSNVSVGGTVTAAQWTTLVNAVNTVRKHQSGAGFSNLSTYVVGSTINATQNFSSNLTTAYTNRLIYGGVGTLVTGSTQTLTVSSAQTTAAVQATSTRTVTFASSDQARYFFNAGGYIKVVVTGYTNTGATVRGSTLGGLAQNGWGGKTIYSNQSSARQGTGYTVITDATTNSGWYGLSGNTTLSNIGGSLYGAVYSDDWFRLTATPSGAVGSYGGKGNVLTLALTAQSGPESAPQWDDSLNVAINYRVDVQYPSTGYLANTWGAVTVT